MIDNLIKWATGLVVAAVAGFAASISYSHLYEISGHNVLLPLCVDGMMIAASLVLLAAYRAKLEPVWWARVTLWLGIAGTLAGNLAYGMPSGWERGFIDSWPALCLVLIFESVMQLAKAKRKRKPMTARELVVQEVKTQRKYENSLNTSKEFDRSGEAVPHATPVFATGSPVPGILAIRKELGCGQPIATDVQKIMRTQHVDMHKALLIRNEEKTSGRH